jgi:hypothetical protein
MTPPAEHALSVGAWLELVMRDLPAGSVPPSATEQTAILDLARVAAHASERIAAPISAYLVGLVLASRPADERAAALQVLVADLEQQVGA